MNEVYAINLYNKLEKKLGFYLGVETIYVRSSWSDSEFYQRNRHLAISSFCSTRIKFKTHLYHEIFHALYFNYKDILPKYLLSPFLKKRPRGLSKNKIIKLEENNEPIPKGYISFYSLEHREEDMAEIWSCFVLNGFKTSGYVEFEGVLFNLEKDIKLKRKFQTMRKIVRYLQDRMD